MHPNDHLVAARRWAKFPATVLFATGLLWLLKSYFQLNIETIGEKAETGIGAIGVFADMVIIPLGSMVVALGLLYLQRWAMLTGLFLPLLPLLILTYEKALRINAKFTEFRISGEAAQFEGGVMTALLVVALWAVYVMMILYLLKALKIMDSDREWLKRPGAADAATAAPETAGLPVSGEQADDEIFTMFPGQNEDDSEQD